MGAVPGVFSRIAVSAPPKDVAPITPPARYIASSESMVKVTGISRASAVVPPSPGITPKHSPSRTPSNT